MRSFVAGLRRLAPWFVWEVARSVAALKGRSGVSILRVENSADAISTATGKR